MKVLVACEFSGIVRDAFLARGHEATSCDLLPSERPGAHVLGDVRTLDLTPFDLLVAFPPCTYLCQSGARWWPGRQREQADAIAFVRALWNAPVASVAIENPLGILSSRLGTPDQIVQGWMFGHPEVRRTCLWLKNLPRLRPTVLTFTLRTARVHRARPGPDRWKERSRTLSGLADAMAWQWGALAPERTSGEERSA
jgi:hypothetical protein